MENISQIKKIEAFLQNTMSQDELAAFKQEMANDPGLAKMVEEFRHTFQALQSQWLSKSVTTAAKSIHLLHVLKVALISVVGVGVLGILIFNFSGKNQKVPNSSRSKEVGDSTMKNVPEIKTPAETSNKCDDSIVLHLNQTTQSVVRENVQENSFEVITAEQRFQEYKSSLVPDTQYFTISNLRDTALKGNSGIVIEIPSGALWSYKNQKPLESRVNIKLVEYMDYVSMYRANISTTANNHLLNSGGSCFIEAKTANDSVIICPNKQLKLSFPCDSINPAMTTFYGSKNEQGTVVWNITDSLGAAARAKIFYVVHDNAPVTYDTLYYVKSFKNVSLTTGNDIYSHLYENKKIAQSQTYYSNSKSHKKWGEYTVQPVRRYGPVSKSAKLMNNIILSNRFGFINCDHFLRENQLEQVTVVGTDTIMESYMFFKNSKSCMPAYGNVFQNIPHNSKVLIVTIMRRNNKLYMSFTNTQTSSVINLNEGKLLNESELEKTIRHF